MKPTICILGAGPSGLALACLLEAKNIDYVVYDRDQSPNIEVQGGCLDLHTELGQRVLKECGLHDQFCDLARYDGQAFKLVDKHCHIWHEEKYDGQQDRPEIDRKQLRDLLMSGIPQEKIIWKSRVENVTRKAGGSIAVHFADGRVEEGFNLIVAADGAWSKARQLLTPAKPKYSGITFLQTKISPSNPSFAKTSSLAGTGMLFSVSDGKMISAQKQGDGSYNVYAGLQLPEFWCKSQGEVMHSPGFQKSLADKEFADWIPSLKDLLSEADGSVHGWPLYFMPTEMLNWKSISGITLIGDSAHVTTPFQGEGVNAAMYDSLQLVEEITRCGLENLDEAVAAYESKMFPRAIDLIERSNSAGDMMFGQNTPEKFAEVFRAHFDEAEVAA